MNIIQKTLIYQRFREEIITELFWAECSMETFDGRDIVDVTKIK